mgnify:CR=1 FL=1
MAGSIVAAASAASDTSSLTVTKPTGTANDDKMIAFQCSDWGTYAGLTAPAGWALLTGLDRGSNNLHLKIWTKTAASEGANYVFPQGSGVDGCCSIVTLRGVDNTVANWLWATPAWAANSSSRVAPTVSGAGSGAVLLCSSLVDMNNTAVTWTPPSGMSEQVDVQSNQWISQSVASLLAPANPTGTKTFTTSSSTFIGSVGGIEWSVVIPATPAVNQGRFFALM